MDAALTFLLKLLGTTARIGAITALTALALCLLVQGQIQPFAQLAGTTLYQTIIVAGIVGFCTVVVEIVIALGRLINDRARRKLVLSNNLAAFGITSKGTVSCKYTRCCTSQTEIPKPPL
jgi:hypothetical protein